MYLVALSEKAKGGLFANAGRRSGDDDDLFHDRVHISLPFPITLTIIVKV
jgi:hypothetical protein